MTAESEGSEVLWRSEAGVATLTLNRPAKRNAMSGTIVRQLGEALERAEADPEARVVVIRGAGPDFCAGADLAELEAAAARGPMDSLDDAVQLGRLYTRMRRHPHPIVSAVHGRALGGGCGLATASDVILAHEEAEFGYPEVALGFVPAIVMAILERKVLEGAAFELVTTGERIPAGEARRIGLVNRVYASGHFENGVDAFARSLATHPPDAVSLTKRLLYGLGRASLEEDVARGAEVNALSRQTDAFREGVRSFFEARSARGAASDERSDAAG